LPDTKLKWQVEFQENAKVSLNIQKVANIQPQNIYKFDKIIFIYEIPLFGHAKSLRKYIGRRLLDKIFGFDKTYLHFLHPHIHASWLTLS